MKLMVPTLMCEAVVKQPFSHNGTQVSAGELIRLSYGQALQLQSLGAVGAMKDEDLRRVEAIEHLTLYGGDSWFPHHLQSVSRVADYLAAQGVVSAEH